MLQLMGLPRDKGLHCWLSGKEPVSTAGDAGSILGLGILIVDNGRGHCVMNTYILFICDH